MARRGCVYQRDGRQGWYARIKVAGDYRYKGGFSTKAMAQAWVTDQMRQDERSAVLGVPPVRADVTFKAFLPRWKKAIRPRVASSTFEGYTQCAEKILEPFFGSRALTKINAGLIEDFLAARSAKGVSPATLNRNLAVLSSILKRALRDRIVATNPVRDVERSRETVLPIAYLTVEDEERLLAALPTWLRTASIIALDAGLRAGEITALRRRDVDLRRRVVTVRQSKNREPREIGMTRRLAETLRSHVRQNPKGQELVVVLPDGRPFSRYVYRYELASAARRAGIERLRFHDLRHMCGVRLAEAGATPAEIQAVLGHKTLAMTMRYIQHAPRDAARSAARLLDRARTAQASRDRAS